jgi:hypothetical protein
LKWRGPYRIIAAQNNYVFEVENIIDKKSQIVHGDRVRFYEEGTLNITEEIKAQFAHDNFSYEVKDFIGVRIQPETGRVQLLVEWKGFASQDNSWEYLEMLCTDVPVLVAKYARKLKLENHALYGDVEKVVNQKS